MDYIDIVLGIILAASAIWGMIRGLTRQVISIIVVVLSFIIAKTYSVNFISITTDSELYNFYHAVWFFVIFILGIIAGFFINMLLSFVVSASSLTTLNRLFGGVFGFIKGALLCMVIIYGLQDASISKTEEWKSSVLIQLQQPINDFLTDKRITEAF